MPPFEIEAGRYRWALFVMTWAIVRVPPFEVESVVGAALLDCLRSTTLVCRR